MLFKRLCLLLLAVCLLLGLNASVEATQLPPGVIGYLYQKDPKVQVRFDGVVIFSNGETYLPVIPQDPTINPDPQKVIKTIPEKAAFPDVIQFDNNYFLLRMIQTASGRITMPKVATYPFAVKEGLLPQDLVVPSNLFIPEELKIILGELPYNPSPDKTSLGVTTAKSLGAVKSIDPNTGAIRPSHTVDNHPTSLFAYSIDDQTLMTVNPDTGQTTGKIELACVPSTMKASLDGKNLYVGCLSNNEIVVIDANASLIKARVPVAERPTELTVIPNSHWLVVSHKYANHITLVDTQTLLPPEASMRIELPGKSGVVAGINANEILVADAYDEFLYKVNLTDKSVVGKIATGLKDLSAVAVITQGQSRPEIWVTSRSESKLGLIDLVSATSVSSQTVGQKPTEMKQLGNKLYILSSDEARIDVMDLDRHTIGEPIMLSPQSFPVTLVFNPALQRAYVGSAARAGITVIDTSRQSVEKIIETAFRSANVAYCNPDASDPKSLVIPEDEKKAASEVQLPARMLNFVPGPQSEDAQPEDPNAVLFTPNDTKPQTLKLPDNPPTEVPTKSIKSEMHSKLQLPLAKEQRVIPVTAPAIQDNILK